STQVPPGPGSKLPQPGGWVAVQRGPAAGRGEGLERGPTPLQATGGRVPQPAGPAERTGRRLREPGNSPEAAGGRGCPQTAASGGPAAPPGRPQGEPQAPDVSPVLPQPSAYPDRGSRGAAGAGGGRPHRRNVPGPGLERAGGCLRRRVLP